MNIRIKDLPAEQRPYERCLMNGAESLSDIELIAILLRSGSKGIQAMDLAMNLMKETNGQGLRGLYNLTINQMTQIKGIGEVKAIQIACLCELSKRLSASCALPKLALNSSESIACYYMERMRHLKQEILLVSMFNSRYELIGDISITKGTVNASLSSPREIFLEALKRDAVYIVLLHNHPSGDENPSEEDLATTLNIAKAGCMLGIRVVDHIIIGDGRYYSFASEGLL